MHCIEARKRIPATVLAPTTSPRPVKRAAFALAALLAAGCTSRSVPPPAPPEPAGAHAPQTQPGAAAAARAPAPALAPPQRVRNWAELRLQAAQRIVAANPGATYSGPVPEPLLAVPVLEIELNADGSVRRVSVLREPRQAKDRKSVV